MNVKTYKGLSHALFLFGLQPIDFAFVCLLTILIWIFTFMALPTIAGGVLSYIGLKRLKHVDLDTRRIFIRYILAPAKIGIRATDIENYKSCLK